MKNYFSQFLYRLRLAKPVRFVVMGYMFYIIIGFITLCFPFMHKNPVSVLDNLFIARYLISYILNSKYTLPLQYTIGSAFKITGSYLS